MFVESKVKNGIRTVEWNLFSVCRKSSVSLQPAIAATYSVAKILMVKFLVATTPTKKYCNYIPTEEYPLTKSKSYH